LPGGKSDPAFRTKPQIGVELVDRARKAGIPFSAVVADSVYRENPNFDGKLWKWGVPYVLSLRPHKGRWAEAEAARTPEKATRRLRWGGGVRAIVIVVVVRAGQSPTLGKIHASALSHPARRSLRREAGLENKPTLHKKGSTVFNRSFASSPKGCIRSAISALTQLLDGLLARAMVFGGGCPAASRHHKGRRDVYLSTQRFLGRRRAAYLLSMGSKPTWTTTVFRSSQASAKYSPDPQQLGTIAPDRVEHNCDGVGEEVILAHTVPTSENFPSTHSGE
jgi:hypothetical protein